MNTQKNFSTSDKDDLSFEQWKKENANAVSNIVFKVYGIGFLIMFILIISVLYLDKTAYLTDNLNKYFGTQNNSYQQKSFKEKT